MSVRKVFQNKRCLFIPYLTVGDPHLEATEAIIHTLVKEGVDAIELGVPFSDPVADGPVIQRASERALQNRIQLKDVFELSRRIRAQGVSIPLILFSYFNPIYRFGVQDFAKMVRESGVNAVLVVDLPPEEAEDYFQEMKRYEIECVFLASPTTSIERLSLIEKYSTGFMYYVSKLGVTGVASENSASLQVEIQKIRKTVRCPIAIGFGVSTPEQAREIAQISDGVIVGSALVKEIAGAGSIQEIKERVELTLKPLIAAVKGAAADRM